MRPEYASTQYGFRWGPVEVTRIGSWVRRRGRGATVVLEVKAGKTKLDIYVSPTGRSVRVYKGNREVEL